MIIMKKLVAEGKSIILITHKLKEIMEISDTVTIIRRGKVIDSVKTSETNPNELAEKMVGRNVTFKVDKKPATPGANVLEVSKLTAKNKEGISVLNQLNLNVRAFAFTLFFHHLPRDAVIEEKAGIEVIGEVHLELQSVFQHGKKSVFRIQPLVLPFAVRHSFALPHIHLIGWNAHDLADHCQARIEPCFMFFIAHTMPAQIFGQVKFVLIQFYTEGKFGQVVIVYPVAIYLHTPGLFAPVLNFREVYAMNNQSHQDHSSRRERLFVAIRLPVAVQQSLQMDARLVQNKLDFRKWTDHRDYHITLQFLGDTLVSDIGHLRKALRSAASGFQPFELQLSDWGTFGLEEAPKVLWKGVSGEIEHLFSCKNKSCRQLRPWGMKLN
ncbi:hypothetical protein ACS72_15830 [Acinetobacter sp. VT 511]|nr:hypothetical protein ACS72_15830 [Acinetobacter sp. VT 511]